MKEVRIQVATARKNFAEVLARAAQKGERIKVVRYRTTLAGIVPGRDLERLDECEDLVGRQSKTKARTAAKAASKKAARKKLPQRNGGHPSKKRTPAKAATRRK
jgi:antitoxin (DNA-binding transcriptional repressor) of toxin-antitoxin stability system